MKGRRPRPAPHRSLHARLLALTSLVAAVSIAATAWLAAQTTSGAIRQEQGQVLADDTRVHDTLLGYAATHPTWAQVGPELTRLAASTGRRIALTRQDGTPIADSAADGTALPPRAAAVLDPLSVDSADRIDPRAVGPFRLTAAERSRLRQLAERRASCLADAGVDASVRTRPSGRSYVQLVSKDPDTPVSPCEVPELERPTATERVALNRLNALVAQCPAGRGGFEGIEVGLDFSWRRTAPAVAASGVDRQIAACVESARRTLLGPHVASPARLFLGSGDSGTTVPGFDLSPANTARLAWLAALVLALAVAVSVLAAGRLVRPLRALTGAAQRMRDGDTAARVPAGGSDDEVGRLAGAFNEMAERRAELEAQRKDMVSDIAHELRTPLSNIRGWVEAAQDGVAEADGAFLESLHEEAMQLQHIVDDLQDLAQADAGELRLHPEPLDLAELLDQTASAHRARAEEAGVTLTVSAEAGLVLLADGVRLRQAVGNLLSNAVRHTPRGGTVRLSAYGDGATLVLEVTDTGSGIAPEDLPHVFDRFWRAEKSRTRRAGGSGLGLAIVRKLTEAHGGSVQVASTPDKGTTFTLRLPR